MKFNPVFLLCLVLVSMLFIEKLINQRLVIFFFFSLAEAEVKLKATLSALGDYFNLSRDGEAHRALSDVLLLSQVFQRLTINQKLSLSDLVLRSYTVSDLTSAMAKNKKD